ncbi:MAG: aminotransferase [Syntrophus sp. (in: bacteria)]|nr:aminotransferase [Syntrophus sp. (in: bacteria)]
MALTLSKRAEGIVQAEIRVMTIECEKAGGINLAQGVCDTGVPFSVVQGAKEAIDHGINSYTRYDGLAELRNAIAVKMLEFNNIAVDPETEITVSAGSTGAFYCACLALLDPGDEVILFEPYYGYHLNTLIAANVVPRYVRMSFPEMKFTVEDLERIVTSKTKGIMVCTPANPSGKVFTEEELRLIAGFAVKHDLFVFTDEIYEYFVYDDKKHMSPGSFLEIADRTVTISGYSKTFSITGWRIGYSVCRKQWADMIGYVNDLIYVCAPAPLQMGVASGIMNLSPDYYKNLCREFKGKRDKLCSALFSAGLTPLVPQGAYYVLADAGSLPGNTGKEKAMYLLEKTGVASVPGSAFYHDDSGENIIRFCFAKTDDVLDEACKRIKNLKLNW